MNEEFPLSFYSSGQSTDKLRMQLASQGLQARFGKNGVLESLTNNLRIRRKNLPSQYILWNIPLLLATLLLLFTKGMLRDPSENFLWSLWVILTANFIGEIPRFFKRLFFLRTITFTQETMKVFTKLGPFSWNFTWTKDQISDFFFKDNKVRENKYLSHKIIMRDSRRKKITLIDEIKDPTCTKALAVYLIEWKEH